MSRYLLMTVLLMLVAAAPVAAVDTLDVQATVKTTVAGEWTTFPSHNVLQRGLPDQDGSMWWGTPDGAIRYDGKGWTKYTSRDGLLDGAVRPIAQAEDGMLWFAGNHLGKIVLTRYDGKTWQTYSEAEGPIGDWIAGFGAIDLQGNLWLRTRLTDLEPALSDPGKGGDGVLRFDGKAWRNFRVRDGLAHNRVYGLTTGPDGSVWFATLKGVSRFDGKEWKTWMSEKKFYRVHVAQDGKVWCIEGDRDGVSVFDGEAWKPLGQADGMPVRRVREICETEDGAMWFGTRGDERNAGPIGLLRYQDGMWLRIGKEDGLPGDDVHSITQAGDGALWLTVPDAGPVRYRPNFHTMGTISGCVVNGINGSSWPGVGISVTDGDKGLRGGAQAQADGRYQVRVFPGRYRVRADANFMAETDTVEVTVEAGELVKDVDLVSISLGQADWKYHAGDNLEWANPDHDDNTWEVVRTGFWHPQLLIPPPYYWDLPHRSWKTVGTLLWAHNLPESGWHGKGWFRLHVTVDAAFSDRPFELHVYQSGNSEIYLDGKLMYQFGKRDLLDWYENAVLKPISFSDKAEHIIAVRYTNGSSERFHRSGGHAGFLMELEDSRLERQVRVLRRELRVQKRRFRSGIYQISLVGIPVTLAFLHLLLFLFYPPSKGNLYYAIFIIVIAAYNFAHLAVSVYDQELSWDVFLALHRYVIPALMVLLGLAGIRFLYSLFYDRLPVQIWIFLGCGTALGFLGAYHFVVYFWPVYSPSPIPSTMRVLGVGFMCVFSGGISVEAIRVVIVAIRRKRDGAWIVGAGFIALVLGLAVQQASRAFEKSAYLPLLQTYKSSTLVTPILDTVRNFGDLAFDGGILSLFILMSVYLARSVARVNRALEARLIQVQELSQKTVEQERALRAEAEEELQAAHEMQMGLMPQESPQVKGFDIAGRCIPANHVGGDFFQYFDQEDRLAVILADVTGSAMEAAIPVVMFSGILEAQMETSDNIEDLFPRLNSSLHRILDSRTFVCFTMGELIPGTRAFRFSNGGCPYPYHYVAGMGEMLELQVDAYPMGVRPDTEYEIIEGQLEPGDRLVFCSDGIVEAENPSEEFFGYDRTMETIRRACEENLSAEETIDRILEEVKAFKGDMRQRDDMTCVVVRVED